MSTRLWIVAAVLAIAAPMAADFTADRAAVTAPVPDAPSQYQAGSLPAQVDFPTGLGEAVPRIEDCAGACPGVVYVWTDRMPLSRTGIAEISTASEALGARLALIGTEELQASADRAPDAVLAEALLGAGALAHAPAVIVQERGQVVGPAILGYKTAAAYEAIIRRRLSASTGSTGDARAALAPPVSPSVRSSPSADPGPPSLTSSPTEEFSHPPLTGSTYQKSATDRRLLPDFEAVGSPGAYFRWVPGREALAYESGGRVYLLDLADGRSHRAPGYVDFVPTPDGRYFVTPGPRRRGLEFYDADQVFEAARSGEPGRVEPIFTDRRMRDQYPSVGILGQEGVVRREQSRTVYRVLTSWFDGIAYRDYEVEVNPRTGASRFRPVGEPMDPCGDLALSIPIMSQDGLEVAARDESTGTTKIFRIPSRGRCSEVVDLGVQTGKVAWHWSGRLLAFARPPLRSGRGGADRSAEGIFLFHRDERRLTRVAGSERASSLAFPEFIGDDALAFLIPGTGGRPSIFRVVEGVR